MSQANGTKTAEARRLLVDRVASSRHIHRSARLRDLLLYLTNRVLDEDVAEIHEQEVGCQVFGRPGNYDTSSDNIVRVHASMLRKRLEQYFADEGSGEPFVVEIPKGNYAPLFREREELPVVPSPQQPAAPLEPAPVVAPPSDWRIKWLALVAGLFACSTGYLLLRPTPVTNWTTASRTSPTVTRFWSQIFHSDKPTDIVCDDAAIGLYQELTGRTISLSDYFDRSYLRNLSETSTPGNQTGSLTDNLVLRRQTSFAGTSFAWKLLQIPGASQRPFALRFARDYSFRELKANNAVLVGNSRYNPWIEPFEPKLGIRWVFDKASAVYDPVDRANNPTTFQPRGNGDRRDSYFSLALLPNLGGAGHVLIISGTGGSAINAGADFLADEPSVAALRAKLPASKEKAFPYFEALIKVKGRSSLPRDATIVICRPPAI
jgi:hypothetical protein